MKRSPPPLHYQCAKASLTLSTLRAFLLAIGSTIHPTRLNDNAFPNSHAFVEALIEYLALRRSPVSP